ncbi:hypothetical protein F4808DRAFT_104041 [Astrocystis sublimbata]|nr:hypothetical protein F4808DRAFT_104041 [Astrocystis sublimbata]
MAVPGTIQALIAAFAFGILFNAASGALIIHVKGHGSAIYRDGLRLVLVLFLLTTLLWALVEFLSTLIDSSATSTCQVAVIFSSLFDQFARVFAEQYLAWAVPKGDAKSVFSLIPQVLVFGRLLLGIGFTAVTRTQFKPTCVPLSSITAVSVATIALDAVIIAFLSIQAFSSGSTTKVTSTHSINPSTKTVRLVAVGVAVWWGTSVTSLLGLDSIDLFYRTALPGIGLTFLVGLITLFTQSLAVPREAPRRPDSPMTRETRDLASSDSVEYPPSRYEDLKEANTVSVSAFATNAQTSRNIQRNGDGKFPPISGPAPVGTEMKGTSTQSDLTQAPPESWGIVRTPGGRLKAVSKSNIKTGKLAISYPILKEDENVQSPLKRIPTIDLAKAANNDRLRREKYAQGMPNLVAQRPAPQPPSFSGASEKTTTELRMAGDLARSDSNNTNKTSSGLSVEGNASSTATQLSPGADAVRRRSPRQSGSISSSAPFKVIRPGEPIKIPIPRPAEPKQEVPAKPEPVKTPLQRRPTTGLPSNPRARSIVSRSSDATSQKTQTVMFVNSIVYDNPDAIGDIIMGAGNVPKSLDSGESVVNRPRPIPRHGDEDRQVFPAEVEPNLHRRSRSAGSIASRKSILQSLPGSPTGLPALPPVPQISKPPNSAKSMTVDEKMVLLYSAPRSAPSSAGTIAKRRSSIPELPPIPAAFQDSETSSISTTIRSRSKSRSRTPKGGRKTPRRTSRVLGITVDPEESSKNHNVEELGGSWLPGISLTADGESFMTSEEAKKTSSPTLPSGSQFRLSSRFGDDETMTNWGSVHSPIAPVARQCARSTYIRKGSRDNSQSEELPIMIADELAEQPMNSDVPLDYKPIDFSVGTSDLPRQILKPFHFRVGDNCPTFSTRKDKPRPREMPPPTPLLLNGRINKRSTMKQPSPMDSPRVAYEVIQAQLKKFEQLDHGVVESPTRSLALLANLEHEMGQLESEWKSSVSVGRNSTSSQRLLSPQQSSTSSTPSIPKRSSLRMSVASAIIDRRGSQRARTNALELGTKRSNTELKPIARAVSASPSPLRSSASQSYDELQEGDRTVEYGANNQPTPLVNTLWTQAVEAQRSDESWLWAPVVNMLNERKQSGELPGLSVRPATRKQTAPLSIESSRLWQHNSKAMSTLPHEGLWNSLPAQPLQSVVASRRVTTRPPRRNKRVTLLPDIIENPEPLPDRRGTLGIFQFPWGEKSENATIQYYAPTQALRAMPGTMATGRSMMNPVANSQFTQYEETEYSSSFFDEYDEEGDNFSDFSGSGDDDFDETTLWEIASLLQTNQGRYENDLLLMHSDLASPTEPPSDMPFLDECDKYTAQKAAAAVDKQSLSNDVARPMLWTQKPKANEEMPDFDLTELFGEFVRKTRPRTKTDDLEHIQSTRLWLPTVVEKGTPTTTFLWQSPKRLSEPCEVSNLMQPVATSTHTRGLWVRSEAVAGSSSFGLPQPEARVWQELTAQAGFVSKPRKQLRSPLPILSSSALWSSSKPTKPTTLWTQPAQLPLSEGRGLFSVNTSRVNYRTTSSPPAALSLRRRVPRPNHYALEPLSSSSLWSPRGQTSAKATSIGLWMPVSQAPNTTMAKSSIGLWQQTIRVETTAPLGLFDPKVPRHDFRRTSKPPAALAVTTTRRTPRGETLIATSHNLWAPLLLQDTSPKDKDSSFLWQGKLRLNKSAPTLFKLDSQRTNYRTTSAEPVALTMVRKPRTIQLPLQRLTTTQMWKDEQTSNTQVNWITMGNLPAAALSPSSSSSASSSPRSSSPVSAATTPDKSKSFFSNWFGKKKQKIPAIPELPDLRELSQEVVVTNLDTIPHTKPIHRALRHCHQRTVPYKANWEAALAEAIAASYPLAKVSESPEFDVTKRHPVFFSTTEVLTETAHPALTGYYVSVISSAVPLASSQAQLLWTKPVESQIASENGLWTLSSNVTLSHGHKYSQDSASANHHPSRRSSTRRSTVEVTTTFEKQGLWKRSDSVNRSHRLSPVQRNWLKRSENMSSLWTKSKGTHATVETGLWAKSIQVKSSSGLTFAQIQDNEYIRYHHIKQGNTAGRSTLKLNTEFGKQGLWKRNNERSHPQNWLEGSANTSSLWTKPVWTQITTIETGLWTGSAKANPSVGLTFAQAQDNEYTRCHVVKRGTTVGRSTLQVNAENFGKEGLWKRNNKPSHTRNWLEGPEKASTLWIQPVRPHETIPGKGLWSKSSVGQKLKQTGSDDTIAFSTMKRSNTACRSVLELKADFGNQGLWKRGDRSDTPRNWLEVYSG